jgi:hypothetical protein
MMGDDGVIYSYLLTRQFRDVKRLYLSGLYSKIWVA